MLSWGYRLLSRHGPLPSPYRPLSLRYRAISGAIVAILAAIVAILGDIGVIWDAMVGISAAIAIVGRYRGDTGCRCRDIG